MKLQNYDLESQSNRPSKSHVLIIIVSFIYWALIIPAHIFLTICMYLLSESTPSCFLTSIYLLLNIKKVQLFLILG